MKFYFRKVLRRLGSVASYKTEKVGGFLVTYEPKTDIGAKLFSGERFEQNKFLCA